MRSKVKGLRSPNLELVQEMGWKATGQIEEDRPGLCIMALKTHGVKKKKIISVLFFYLVTVQMARAQQFSAQDSTGPNLKDIRSKWEYGTGYFLPSNINSRINTINLDLYFWKKYFRHATVLVNIGTVVSYGSGYVDRLEINGTELVNKRHYCQAAGAGPSLQIQFPFVRLDRFSMEAEANGSFLLYTSRFPYGGYIYNFMFRTGPNFCWTLNQQFTLKLGYRWMHVSNGSGAGFQNPWYNAQGITLSITKWGF
jgi:hypothetical protein